MNKLNRKRQAGFTLVEMLMVIVLIGILASIAIPQFVDFRVEAKNAAVATSVGTLRTAIAIQSAHMIMKCKGVTVGTFPTMNQLVNNSIVVPGGPCDPLVIPRANWPFVFRFPENAWSGTGVTAAGRRAITQCAVGTGCLRNGAVSCNGTAWGPTIGGWCYNPATGDIWANSNNNGVAAPRGEYSI